MKVRNLINRKCGLCGFMAGMLVLVLFFACLPAFATAAEKRTYEEYVSSLPKGYEPVPRECFEQAIEEGELIIYNWAEWWPEEELYGGFYKEFGIKVKPDYFSTNDEMMAKFKLNPDLGYDLSYAGGAIFMRLKAFGVRFLEINHDWVPNVNKYLKEEFKNLWFDVGYRYQLPFSFYLFGYGINTKHVNDPRIPSWAVLLEPDEKYAGKVTVYDDMQRTIGTALKYLGYSINTVDEQELMKAKELLLRQKPYVMAYDSWPKRQIVEESAWIVNLWIGDFFSMHRANENIMAVLPAEGTLMGNGNLIMPSSCPHPAAAHLFMNYLFRPDINALLLEAIAYSPVHTTSHEFLSDEMKNWPGVKISDEYYEKSEFMNSKSFTGKGLELRTAIWEELKR